MAVAEVEEGEKKNGKSGTKVSPRARKTRAKGLGEAGAAHGKKAPRTASGVVVEPVDDGYEFLRRLVKKTLQEKGQMFSDSLLDKAIDGNTNAVWAVIELLKPTKQTPAQPKRQGRSLAEIWASEPVWKEASEETAEVGAGSREPEA